VLERVTAGSSHEQRKAKLGQVTTGLRQDAEFYYLACRSEGRKPSTLVSYRKNLSALITFLERQGITESSDITTTHFRLWMLDLEQRMSRVSVRDYVVVGRTWLKWMYNEGIIPINPAATIRAPKAPVKVMQTFSTKQLQDMLTVCDHDANQTHLCDWWLGLRNKAMILVLVTTGMRESELARMQLEHFIMDYSRIKVTDTKNGEERVVAIDEKVQQVVLRYLLVRRKLGPEHGFVWVGRRLDPLSGEGVYRALRKVGRRAGVDVPRFVHAFRHTAGTRAMLNGASQRETGDMLGHKTEHMTRRYTQHIGSEQAAERHKAWAPTKGLRI